MLHQIAKKRGEKKLEVSHFYVKRKVTSVSTMQEGEVELAVLDFISYLMSRHPSRFIAGLRDDQKVAYGLLENLTRL